MIFESPINKRLEQWRINLAEAVAKLMKMMEPEELKNNEEFISVVMYANQIAMRTHQEEKLKALRNAVFNTAINKPDLNFAKKQIFLNYINDLTALHLTVLTKLYDDYTFTDQGDLTIPEILFPELTEDEGFIRIVYNDLVEKNLYSVNFDGNRPIVSNKINYNGKKFQPNRGKQFYEFITSKELK